MSLEYSNSLLGVLGRDLLNLVFDHLPTKDLCNLQLAFPRKNCTAHTVATSLRHRREIKQLYLPLFPHLEGAGLLKSDASSKTGKFVIDYLKGGSNARERWQSFAGKREFSWVPESVVERLAYFDVWEEFSLYETDFRCDQDDPHKRLAERGWEHVWANAQDRTGCAPLHIAAGYENREEVARLIGAGADPNLQDEEGQTPLCWAVVWNELEGVGEVIEELIKAGTDIERRDQEGHLPFDKVLWGNQPTIVSQFIKAGADVNGLDSQGWTPLHRAASKGRCEVAKVLIDAGAKLHAETQGGELTALDLAMEGEHADMVELLKEHGAESNPRGPDGKTQLG